MSKDTPKALPAPSTTSPDAAPPEEAKPSLGDVVTQFVTDVDSLADSLPLTQLGLLLGQAATGKQLTKFKAVDKDNYLQAFKVLKQHKKSVAAQTLITRSFLVSLVSQFDALLGGVLRTLFVLKPEIINIGDKQISYAELLVFESLEIARDYIIEKEIETVLRKSHSEQFEWLENRFNLPLRKGLTIWPNFIELTERRNLFVHTSGKVSQQYLDVCEKHKVHHETPVARNDKLHIDVEYFKQACECVLEIGVKLAHTLWRKQLPDDRKEADTNLTNVCYELISESKYRLAELLLAFAIDQKKTSSDEHRRTFIINHAQALKWSGDEKGARKVLTACDWTASNNMFRLAVKVLLDEFDEAAKIMRSIGPSGRPSKVEYRDWPLFSRFRPSQQFSSTFSDVFGEPFSEAPPSITAEIEKALSELQTALAPTAVASAPAAPKTKITPERQKARGQLERQQPSRGKQNGKRNSGK